MSEHNTKDYPDHLNPFKKSGIRSSFRNLKRTLRQSFKWSQEKKPEVCRREPAGGAVNHNGHSGFESVALRNTDNVHRSQTLMLPRSRFNERVNQAKTLCPSTKPPTDPNDKFLTNPFEDENSDDKIIEENEQNPFSEEQEKVKAQEVKKEHGKGTIRRHRRKKRAPLPPGLNNSGNGFLSVPDINNSKWSLNSYDTDCSVYTYGSETEDPNDNDNFEPNKNELKDIQEMSVEIQKYYNASIDSSEPKTEADSIHETDLTLKNDREIVIDDVIENVSETKKEDGSCKNVGESQVEDQKGLEITSTHEESIQKQGVGSCEANIVHELESTKKFEEEEISAGAQNVVTEGCEIQNVQLLGNKTSSDQREEVVDAKAQEKLEELEKVKVKKVEEVDKSILHITEDVDVKKEEKKEINKEEHSEEMSKEVVSEQVEMVSAYSEELDYKNNNVNVLSEAQSYENELNYCTTNGIYIAASSDNLNGNDQILFSERKSLYITGSRDELNSDGSNEIIERNESPVPKVRKHKLTKSALLGTQHDN